MIPLSQVICFGDGHMMGLQAAPERLFYDFCLEEFARPVIIRTKALSGSAKGISLYVL